MNKPSGMLYLVGAGPGDPALITLRGIECLRQADVVLYDYLANPDILVHAERAEKICLGKHGHSRIWPQHEINARVVALAKAGKVVVRLKGGDPSIFGRGAEEAEAALAAGISFEMVPGVSAGLAAASYAGIPLTHRDYASAVALVTGQEKDEKQSLDYGALASFPGTLVVYMGVTTAERWVGQLLRAGKPPDTPAAIVRRCSLPDQRTWQCRLADVPAVLRDGAVRPPALVIIGPTVALASRLDWFTRRPLFGRRILVTRPREQIEDLAAPLSALGAQVLLQPAIEIGPPRDWSDVDRCLQQLEHFDWIVFSSANGVRYFLERLWESGGDVRRLGHARLAVIGPGTARQLERYALRADLQPAQYVAEALADALAPHVANQRVLLVRASRGREVLRERLEPLANELVQVVAYHSQDVALPDPQIAADMEQGAIDWVTVSSSAIATSLWQMFGQRLQQTQLVSISPITSATLRRHGLEPAAEAAEQTMDGMVQCLLENA